jgi:hypothetical protein
MKRMRWSVIMVVALLLWSVALPVVAQGGRSTIIAQDYALEEGETLADDLVVIAGHVRLERDSAISGDVTIMGGEVELRGSVDGDVVVFGGSVALAATAVIEGDLVVFGSISRHPDARVSGNVVSGLAAGESLRQLPQVFRAQPETLPGRPSPMVAQTRPAMASAFEQAMRSLSTLLAILLVAVLGMVLLPDQLERVARTMESSPLACFGVGLLTIIVVVVLVPLLVIICFGIPVAVILGLALVLCALLGWIGVGRLVGAGLTRMLRLAEPTPIVETLLGVLIITIAAMLPCVGPALAILLASWGIGAVVLTRAGTMSYAGASFAGPPHGRAPEPEAPPPADETRRLDESPYVDDTPGE